MTGDSACLCTPDISDDRATVAAVFHNAGVFGIVVYLTGDTANIRGQIRAFLKADIHIRTTLSNRTSGIAAKTSHIQVSNCNAGRDTHQNISGHIQIGDGTPLYAKQSKIIEPLSHIICCEHSFMLSIHNSVTVAVKVSVKPENGFPVSSGQFQISSQDKVFACTVVIF